MAKSKGPSRISLTIRSLFYMVGLGAFLALYNVYTSHRDLGLALGPESLAQQSFFVDAADRPDIKIFYRKMTDAQKAEMAKNIGRYKDPQLAKLCAILLGDFSANARALLTQTLISVGKVHPDAVAAQLSQTGSFEQYGVRQALVTLGQPALPYIVAALTEPAKKTPADDVKKSNAEDYLVLAGQPAIPTVMPLLTSSDNDTRMAAVLILGKLRATQAAGSLLDSYPTAPDTDKAGILTAIASIGDPAAEPLLSQTLSDPKVASALRTQSALGLGRIASTTAVQELWKFAVDPDAYISDGSLAALLLCKDKALADLSVPENLRLKVASGFESPMADHLIASDMTKPGLQNDAALAAANRTDLVPNLKAVMESPVAHKDGVVADSAIAALLTTQAGRVCVQAFKSDPSYAGLIQRREVIEKG